MKKKPHNIVEKAAVAAATAALEMQSRSWLQPQPHHGGTC